MSNEETPPTTPLRSGHYWQREVSGEWRQVRPINWFWLQQYYAKEKRNADDTR